MNWKTFEKELKFENSGATALFGNTAELDALALTLEQKQTLLISSRGLINGLLTKFIQGPSLPRGIISGCKCRSATLMVFRKAASSVDLDLGWLQSGKAIADGVASQRFQRSRDRGRERKIVRLKGHASFQSRFIVIASLGMVPLI